MLWYSFKQNSSKLNFTIVLSIMTLFFYLRKFQSFYVSRILRHFIGDRCVIQVKEVVQFSCLFTFVHTHWPESEEKIWRLKSAIQFDNLCFIQALMFQNITKSELRYFKFILLFYIVVHHFCRGLCHWPASYNRALSSKRGFPSKIMYCRWSTILIW